MLRHGAVLARHKIAVLKAPARFLCGGTPARFSVRNLGDSFCRREIASSYAHNGFAIFDDLLSSGEVDSLMEEMVSICRGDLGILPGLEPCEEDIGDHAVLSKYLAIHFPHKLRGASRVQNLVAQRETVSALRCVMAVDNIKCLQTMMFLKVSGMPGQAAHQDEFYIPTRDRSLTATWIALDPATVENGCLWVVPGSHKPGLLYPNSPHHDNRFDSAGACTHMPYGESDWVPVELPSGGAVIFNGYLVHRSLPNRAARGTFRRAFANHYCRTESKVPWSNDGRFAVTGEGDMRDYIVVSGEDSSACWAGKDDFLRPFVRPTTVPK